MEARKQPESQPGLTPPAVDDRQVILAIRLIWSLNTPTLRPYYYRSLKYLLVGARGRGLLWTNHDSESAVILLQPAYYSLQYSWFLNLQQRTTTIQPADALTVHVAGHPARLHYDVTGPEDGDSVLVLHGWGSSAAVMTSVARFLSVSYRVFNLDLPGHGNSPVPPVPWSLDDHASAVRKFIETQIPGNFSIFGHSNGGRIALYLASDPSVPEGLRKLVLVSPSGIRRRRTIKIFIRVTLAKILKAPFQLLPGRAGQYGMDWLKHTLLWSYLGSSDYRAVQGVMRDTFVRTVNTDVEDRLERINIPVLLFWGDRDDAIDDEQMRKLEAGLVDAGLVVIKGAGHFAFLDDPGIIEAGTMHFLAGS